MAAKTKPSPAKGGQAKQGYDDTNRGALFVNDKGDNDARPDYTGNVKINPEDFEPDASGLLNIRLAGWMKQSKAGNDYISIQASQPQAK